MIIDAVIFYGDCDQLEIRLADKNYVRQLLSDGIRFDNGQKLTRIDIDESFPDGIRLNQKKYKNFIR